MSFGKDTITEKYEKLLNLKNIKHCLYKNAISENKYELLDTLYNDLKQKPTRDDYTYSVLYSNINFVKWMAEHFDGNKKMLISHTLSQNNLEVAEFMFENGYAVWDDESTYHVKSPEMRKLTEKYGMKAVTWKQLVLPIASTVMFAGALWWGLQEPFSNPSHPYGEGLGRVGQRIYPPLFGILMGVAWYGWYGIVK